MNIFRLGMLMFSCLVLNGNALADGGSWNLPDQNTQEDKATAEVRKQEEQKWTNIDEKQDQGNYDNSKQASVGAHQESAEEIRKEADGQIKDSESKQSDEETFEFCLLMTSYVSPHTVGNDKECGDSIKKVCSLKDGKPSPSKCAVFPTKFY